MGSTPSVNEAVVVQDEVFPLRSSTVKVTVVVDPRSVQSNELGEIDIDSEPMEVQLSELLLFTSETVIEALPLPTSIEDKAEHEAMGL